MAKIAFFDERLPAPKASSRVSIDSGESDSIARSSFDLALSLADQQHEIRIFSTYRPEDELPPTRGRLEIVRPFRKWNWLEIPRLVPMLMEFQPDILHIIEPRAESLKGFTNALDALIALKQMPLWTKRPALVVSFFDLREKDLRSHQLLFQQSDAISVANEPQLELVVKALKPLKRQPLTAIVPIGGRFASSDAGETLDEWSQESILAGESALNSAVSGALFIPGDIHEHRDPEKLFSALTELLAALENSLPDLQLVFGGGWGQTPIPTRHRLMDIFVRSGFGSRVRLTGPLGLKELRQHLIQARLIFTASLPAESLTPARLFRLALDSSALLLMSERQAEHDALRWLDGVNTFITRDSDWFENLKRVLTEPEEKLNTIRQGLQDFAREAAVDQPGNIMSRLYSSVLSDSNRNGTRP